MKYIKKSVNNMTVNRTAIISILFKEGNKQSPYFDSYNIGDFHSIFHPVLTYKNKKEPIYYSIIERHYFTTNELKNSTFFTNKVYIDENDLVLKNYPQLQIEIINYPQPLLFIYKSNEKALKIKKQIEQDIKSCPLIDFDKYKVFE